MAEPKSKARFIVVDGMLGWGVTAGLLWAFFMSRSNGRPFVGYALAALLLFPLAGAGFGWILWRLSHRDAAAAPAASPVPAARPALPVEADTRPLRILGWAGVALSGSCAACLAFANAWGPAALGLLLAAVSGYLVATAGTIRADAEQIAYACPLGRFALRWSELTHVETDEQHQAVVLCAGDRRLPLVGAGFWSGPRKPELVAFLDAQLAERGIPTRTTSRALFRLPRNVRVTGAGVVPEGSSNR